MILTIYFEQMLGVTDPVEVCNKLTEDMYKRNNYDFKNVLVSGYDGLPVIIICMGYLDPYKAHLTKDIFYCQDTRSILEIKFQGSQVNFLAARDVMSAPFEILDIPVNLDGLYIPETALNGFITV